MKPAVDFIHTADLHLGSRIQINESYKDLQTKDYNEAVYNSFKKIVDNAIKTDVDFVLISGDIFDSDSRSVRATRFFIEQSQRLDCKDIAIYMINGNHDPYRNEGELLNLPKNVHVCDSEQPSCFTVHRNNRLIARILGQSYRSSSENRKMSNYYTVNDQRVYNIALLHTQLDLNNKSYVPVSKDDLLKKNSIDYWALGHIHKKQIINGENPYIIYPGIPQGRDMGEMEPGGYFIVHLEPNNCYYDFKKTSDYVYRRFEVDLGKIEINNISDLHELLEKELNEFYQTLNKNIKGYIIRIILKGNIRIYELLQEKEEEINEDILSNLRPLYLNKAPLLFINGIVNRSSKYIENMEELIKKDPFFKDFFNFLEELKSDDEEIKKLKNDLGRIWNSKVDIENKDPQEFQLGEQVFKELFEQSKFLIMKEFIERRDL